MKKIPIMFVAGAIIFMLSSCGQVKNAGEVQADTINSILQNRKETDETDQDGKEDTAYDVLDRLMGEYRYTSDDATGKLMIQKTSGGYSISDYDSEFSYRFLADSSNIENIENNKIYIKYPEQVLSDDTVDFGYYILEYDTDGIEVYYGETAFEEAHLLYRATKQNDKDTKQGTDDYSVSTAELIDYEALGIKEYEYPAEFSMGDNLKSAIAQLALDYESFNRDIPRTRSWKENFIAAFILNSRVSFDYLDLISDQNNGQISIDELNYIQYSLTNTKLDFSSAVSGSIDRHEAASFMGYGSITGYDYKDTDSGVLITADLEVVYDGAKNIQKYEITAELIRNPYSCFDGYSIIAFSTTTAGNIQGETNQSETTAIENSNQNQAIELYGNVLRNYISAGKTDFTVSFIDLDDDSTREMVVFFGESQADGGYLFTIKNEEAIQILPESGDCFGQYGGFTYKEKGNVFVTENEAVTEVQISSQIFYYIIENGNAVCKDVTQSITQFDSDESKFYVNDTEVERELFNSIAEKYGLLEMSTVSYSDGVRVMNGQMDSVYNAYNNS